MSVSPHTLALTALSLDGRAEHIKQASMHPGISGALLGALAGGGVQGIRRLFASKRDKRNGEAPSILKGLLLGGALGGGAGMGLPMLTKYLQSRQQAQQPEGIHVGMPVPPRIRVPESTALPVAENPTDMYDAVRAPYPAAIDYTPPEDTWLARFTGQRSQPLPARADPFASANLRGGPSKHAPTFGDELAARMKMPDVVQQALKGAEPLERPYFGNDWRPTQAEAGLMGGTGYQLARMPGWD